MTEEADKQLRHIAEDFITWIHNNIPERDIKGTCDVALLLAGKQIILGTPVGEQIIVLTDGQFGQISTSMGEYTDGIYAIERNKNNAA